MSRAATNPLTYLSPGVGIQGRNILWTSAGYGMMGVIANAICLCFIDRVGRKKPLTYTNIALCIDMILIMVFTKYFSDSANKIGQGFTIAWIFVFSIIFSLGYNAIQLVYIAEIFPTPLRSRATAICAFMGTGVGLLFNQVSPMAFAGLQWRYYAVFIACDVVAAGCFFVFYPETKGKTLEEMAELFGDRVAFTEFIGEWKGDAMRDEERERERERRGSAAGVKRVLEEEVEKPKVTGVDVVEHGHVKGGSGPKSG